MVGYLMVMIKCIENYAVFSRVSPYLTNNTSLKNIKKSSSSELLFD
jgi:hypothetical protein